MLFFHSFKASGLTFSRLHQRVLKRFKEAAVSLGYLGKSILGGNLYLGPLEIILRMIKLQIVQTWRFISRRKFSKFQHLICVFAFSDQTVTCKWVCLALMIRNVHVIKSNVTLARQLRLTILYFLHQILVR